MTYNVRKNLCVNDDKSQKFMFCKLNLKNDVNTKYTGEKEPFFYLMSPSLQSVRDKTFMNPFDT